MTEETAGTPRTDAPKIIYLQDGDGEELGEKPDYEGITWCEDEITGGDTKYIRFDVHEREVAALTTQRDEAEALSYVPGAWQCAKCNLRLIHTNLHVHSGTMSANNEPQQCVNGCGPMWRVSERDDRQDAQRQFIAESEKFESHTKAVAEWTSTVAEIIGLGEHGKVTPDQILDQLIYGRQWASDMQTKLTTAEAQRDELQKRIGYTAVPVAEGGANTFEQWWEGVKDKPPYTPKEMSRAAWNAAEAELDAAKRALAEMGEVISELLETTSEPPTANCSCHLHPPCADCEEYGAVRELRQRAAALAAKSTEPKED